MFLSIIIFSTFKTKIFEIFCKIAKKKQELYQLITTDEMGASNRKIKLYFSIELARIYYSNYVDAIYMDIFIDFQLLYVIINFIIIIFSVFAIFTPSLSLCSLIKNCSKILSGDIN